MPKPSASDKKFIEELRHLSPAARARRLAEEAKGEAKVAGELRTPPRTDERATTFGQWHEPEAKKLSGLEDIYEIRFKAQQRQHRPLGFFGPGASEFTILVWAEKKQSCYKPTDALESANKRRKRVLDGSATVAPLTIDGEEFPTVG